MKIKISTILITFVWCIFMGVTAISIGFGAIFPSMNRISKPFICPNGEMTLETQDYYPSPVETVTTLTWYCVDSNTGGKVELGIFPMSLYAGAIYGLLLFAAVFIIMLVLAKKGRSDSSATEDFSWGGYAPHKVVTAKKAEQIEKRLVELNRLHDKQLISEEEYHKKRVEILEDL